MELVLIFRLVTEKGLPEEELLAEGLKRAGKRKQLELQANIEMTLNSIARKKQEISNKAS